MSKGKVLIWRLLNRNISKSQLAGFVLSNFVGLAIVITGIQFYADIRSIWEKEDSFIRQDFLVVNKQVTSSNTLGRQTSEFSEADIDDLESQPWVRKVGEFEAADYNVYAVMDQGGNSMSTSMFFESIPDDFIDVKSGEWGFREGDKEIPVIVSKDYLTLYNFGFASSAGMPQLTESMMGSLPLILQLRSHDGSQSLSFKGRIVGFSNRLNTILVPEDFMKWSNARLGGKDRRRPSRIIIDTSSPGDVAITDYLSSHSLEQAGDKTSSQAAYFLNIIAGLIVGIGAVITILSFFILLLSVALLMQKNREKLHLLIMLGIDLSKIGRPYEWLTGAVSILSFVLAVIAMLIFRNIYIRGVEDLSGDSAGIWISLCCGAVLTLFTLIFNVVSIRRKVRGAF